MPFGTQVEYLTVQQAITEASYLHLSPEKAVTGDVDGTSASKTVDRHNARHPGSSYHPLMILIGVDAAVTTDVSVDFDSGTGSAYDCEILAPTAMAPFTAGPAAGDGLLINLDSTHPGLIIFPKGTRAAPDSLRVLFAASAGETVSVTFIYEILE